MKSKRAINSRRFALNPLDRFARFRIRVSLLIASDDKMWYSIKEYISGFIYNYLIIRLTFKIS